jgi:DNA mismatch repair protein MutH
MSIMSGHSLFLAAADMEGVRQRIRDFGATLGLNLKVIDSARDETRYRSMRVQLASLRGLTAVYAEASSALARAKDKVDRQNIFIETTQQVFIEDHRLGAPALWNSSSGNVVQEKGNLT